MRKTSYKVYQGRPRLHQKLNKSSIVDSPNQYKFFIKAPPFSKYNKISRSNRLFLLLPSSRRSIFTYRYISHPLNLMTLLFRFNEQYDFISRYGRTKIGFLSWKICQTHVQLVFSHPHSCGRDGGR